MGQPPLLAFHFFWVSHFTCSNGSRTHHSGLTTQSMSISICSFIFRLFFWHGSVNPEMKQMQRCAPFPVSEQILKYTKKRPNMPSESAGQQKQGSYIYIYIHNQNCQGLMFLRSLQCFDANVTGLHVVKPTTNHPQCHQK